MRDALRGVPFVLALLVLCAAHLRADVTLQELAPSEGTVGTPLQLELLGDLGKGKPKLWLTRSDDVSPNPKKTMLKVSSVEALSEGGGSIVSASFKKTKTGAGVYDLHVKPKGKGQVEQVFDGAFEMRAPMVESVTPESAPAKSQITIAGAFFGEVGKPVVRLEPVGGGKSRKAKVLGVSEGTSLFVNLPKLAADDYTLSVSTKVGDGTLALPFSVLAPASGASSSLSAMLDGPSLPTSNYVAEVGKPKTESLLTFYTANPELDLISITADIRKGPTVIVLHLTITGFAPGVTATPVTFTGSGLPAARASMGYAHGKAGDPAKNWLSLPDGLASITITSATADRIVGSFEGTLPASAGTGATGVVTVTSGEFDLEVTQL